MTTPQVPRARPILRHRPDIRSAERSLAAATARIGVATADLFPRVTFIGSVGLQADTFARLSKSGAGSWNFEPQITWAAFDLGRVQARIKAEDARTEASLAFCERTACCTLWSTAPARAAWTGNDQRGSIASLEAKSAVTSGCQQLG
ncbi:MAG: TolC family protein [Gammaproteobacteria bacterium]